MKIKKANMPIYTRTGDKGETSLFGGKRVSKTDIRVEAYGTVDELNSLIGIALPHIGSFKSFSKALKSIQADLLTIGATLANPKALPLAYLEKRVTEFEQLIDKLTKQLPELRNFILPGGGKGGSSLHLLRSVSRRAERRIIALSLQQDVDPNILIYFNRLSDLFFTIARFVNYKQKKKETIWKKTT